jgi:hypothetical protein
VKARIISHRLDPVNCFDFYEGHLMATAYRESCFKPGAALLLVYFYETVKAVVEGLLLFESQQTPGDKAEVP